MDKAGSLKTLLPIYQTTQNDTTQGLIPHLVCFIQLTEC